MTARRNKVLALIFVIMMMTSAFLLLRTRRPSPSDIDREQFKLRKSEEVNRVSLVSQNSSVELTFENNRWRLNGKWDADPQMIRVLFATMKQVEPRRPVANAMQDSIRKLLAQNGTHVEFFSGGQLQMGVTAGGNAAKSEAWFVRDGEKEVYVMMIPGYRVYVSGVLELDESGWRNKRIFDFNWRNFRTLKASYPKEPTQGFTVEMRDRVFGIKELTHADTTKLNDYLDAVSLLFATRFVPKSTVRDSLLTATPAAHIEILDVADRSYTLDIFAPRKNDVEVFGKIGDDIVAFERNDVEQIVRRKEWFRQTQSGSRR